MVPGISSTFFNTCKLVTYMEMRVFSTMKRAQKDRHYTERMPPLKCTEAIIS
jgi:hypothetical protein